MENQILNRLVNIIDDGPLGYLFKKLVENEGYSCKNPIKDFGDLRTSLQNGDYSLVFINGDFGRFKGNWDNKWNAINLVIGTAENTAPLIIYSLENEESFLGKAKANENCPELCKYKDLWKLIQLPQKPEDIISTIKSICDNYSKDKSVLEKRRNFCNEVAKRLVKRQDEDLRHVLGNAMAAGRILNGAILSGDYNILDEKQTSHFMQSYHILIDKSNTTDKNQKKEMANELINSAKNKLKSDNCSPSQQTWHDNIKKILVVDDQRGIWEPVWKFLLKEEKIDFVEDGDEAVEQIKKNGDEYDCVVLDVWLGRNKENGLEVLQCIKQNQYALPVIMMTAYDDATLTYDCYKYGATSYFCKEREDSKNRDSVEYYKKLRKLIKHATSCYNYEIRRLWKQFLKVECGISKICPEAADDLRRAYFFLTLDQEEFRVKKFLININSPHSQYIIVIYYAYECLEKILTLKLEEKGIDEINGKNIKLISAKTKLDKLKESGDQSPGESLVNKLLELGPNTSHVDTGYWECKKSSLPENAKICFTEIITWTEELLSILKQHSSLPLSESEIKQDVQSRCIDDYSQPVNARLQHEERSRAGAIRLLEGAYLSLANQDIYFRKNELSENSSDDKLDTLRQYYEDIEHIFIDKASPIYNCLFVDDDGEESGWKMVLEKLLPDFNIDYIKYTGDTDREKILMYTELSDFIILDLKLPGSDGNKNEKYGIKLLDILKERRPSIPILVLTASDDSMWTRKSITHGAMEYFPKTNRDYYRVEEREYFTDYYKQFNKIVNRMKDSLGIYTLNDIYSKLRLVSHYNRFRCLDVLEAELKSKLRFTFFNASVKSEYLSELVYTEIVRQLNVAYFFYTPDRSITLNFSEKRLLSSSNVTHCQQVIFNCVKVVEYCLRLAAGLYTGRIEGKPTAGRILYNEEYREFQDICPNEYREMAKSLWKLRNIAKDTPSELTANDTKQVMQETVDFVLQTETLLWEIISTKYFNLQKDRERNSIIVKICLTKKIRKQLQKRFEVLQRSNSEKKGKKKDWEFFNLQLTKGIIRDIIDHQNDRKSFKQIISIVPKIKDDLESLVTKINEKYREINRLHNEIYSLSTDNKLKKEEKEKEEKSWSQAAGNTRQIIHEHFQSKINKLNDSINEIENSISIKEKYLYEMKLQLTILTEEYQQMRNLIDQQWKRNIEEITQRLRDNEEEKLSIIGNLDKARRRRDLNTFCVSTILALADRPFLRTILV